MSMTPPYKRTKLRQTEIFGDEDIIEELDMFKSKNDFVHKMTTVI